MAEEEPVSIVANTEIEVTEPSTTAAPAAAAAESMTLPLELIDECIGKKVRAYLRDHHVFEGTLVGFDDLVNLVLDNVVDIGGSTNNVTEKRMLLSSRSLTMIAPLE